MKNKNLTLDEIIKRELTWHRRLWRWLFPPKPLSIKDIEKAWKRLKKYESA